ncbi:MAG TPA: SulP family inorganic anion transporter [Cyclobacteriaceae bacterium]|nr:SulP family inorganic anion transporter [Cyclobacteriaceae bacterium]
MDTLKESWRGDLYGGLNTAIVALPLAMAFGVESGLGASAGIAGAISLGIIATFFGGTPLLISGPTGAMTVVSSLVIARSFEQSPDTETALATIFIIFLLTGVFQIFFGLIKVGQYIRFVPYPLVSGFMSGIGLLMIIFQILPLLGHTSSIHFNEIMQLLRNVTDEVNFQALALGIITILIIYFFPAVTKKVPATLAALVGATAIAVVLKLDVPTIRDIPDNWITWRWDHLVDYDHASWSVVVLPALTLAFLGSIDTLLTSLVVDITTGSTHKSNKELIGQGLGNIASAIAGGIPGAGATLRTLVNVRSGARTKVSVIIQCVVLLLVLFEIGFVKVIPLSVLAGILITVGISIIDYKGLRQVFAISFSDGVVMVAVMVVTVVFGLPQAFATGIVLASVLFVKKMADQSLRKTESVLLLPSQESDSPELEPFYTSREVYVQQLNGPLFFGFAVHFREAMQAFPEARAIIFRMENVPFIDHSGIVALQEAIRHLKNKDILVLFSGLQPLVRTQMKAASVIPGVVDPEMIFKSFSPAADWLQKYLAAHPAPKLRKANLKKDLDLNKLKDRRN